MQLLGLIQNLSRTSQILKWVFIHHHGGKVEGLVRIYFHTCNSSSWETYLF